MKLCTYSFQNWRKKKKLNNLHLILYSPSGTPGYKVLRANSDLNAVSRKHWQRSSKGGRKEGRQVDRQQGVLPCKLPLALSCWVIWRDRLEYLRLNSQLRKRIVWNAYASTPINQSLIENCSQRALIPNHFWSDSCTVQADSDQVKP